ncbi:MAG: hypothetical protein RQ885_11125 [Desulfurococcales archaeon]|nr:hypothetical protein [Desulfurococcales archaeon]
MELYILKVKSIVVDKLMCMPGRKGSLFILCEERSESRRGLHKRRRIPLVIRSDSIYPAVGSKTPVKPLYAVGDAYEVLIGSRGDELYVQIDLVMNPRRRVKGYIAIYDASGNMLIRAKYEKLKLRLSKGSSKYGRLIEQVARYLNIPYKNVNWMGSRPHRA